MLRRLCDIIPKAFHNLVAHHVLVRLRKLSSPRLNLGIEIAPILRHFQKPRLMIDAGDLIFHAGAVHAHHVHQIFGAGLHAVAQADGFDGTGFQHRSSDDGHRVSIVQKPCVGT